MYWLVVRVRVIACEQYKRGQNISPKGFKIALELYVKCACKNSTEGMVLLSSSHDASILSVQIVNVCFGLFSSPKLSIIPNSYPHAVPFSFGVRVHGESKLTGKVIINYLSQLWELYQYKMPGVLPLFLLILLLLACYVAFVLYTRLLR